jgi:hypothetical protein
MAEFNIRSDSVDVEQIMQQIRSRIREKRGVDYTEEQIQELASVRLEKFLDPKNLRSDLLEQFRRSRPSPEAEPPAYIFEDHTIFDSHRWFLRATRALLKPILKLFFNPNPIILALHRQAQLNVEHQRDRAAWNALYYEVLHNLVLETTRTGIEVKNLKMRVESLTSRLDFSERRVRALEGVVQYRPEAIRTRERRAERVERTERGAESPVAAGVPAAGGESASESGAESVRRRRRRRRGRRSGASGEAVTPDASQPGGEAPVAGGGSDQPAGDRPTPPGGADEPTPAPAAGHRPSTPDPDAPAQ